MSLLKSRFIEMFKNSETLRLDQIAEVTMGQSPDSSSYNSVGKGIPFYQGKTEFTDKYIGQPSTWCTSPTRIAKENDILMSVRAPVGNVNIATEECCIGRGLSSIRPQNGFNSEFIFEALEQKKEELENKATGSTFKAINKDIVLSIQIPNTSISIQKEYSNFVKQIDKSKFLLQQILEKLELLKKSRFIELIGNIQNPKYQLVELNEICEFIKDGTHQTPIYTEDRVNGFKFLSSKDVTSQKINWSNIKYIPKELHEQLYAKLSPKRDDILLAKNGTTGVAAVVDSDEIFDIYVSLALLRPKSGVNVSYLCSALNSEDLKRQFNSSLKGIGVPNLHLREIKKARIIFPPIDIQNKISSITEQIDKSKLIIQKTLEDLVGKV